MTATIAETPYCRLYIDTVETRAAVQAALDRSASIDFEDLSVFAPVFRNDGYEPTTARAAAYDPIVASIWTAEIGTETTDPKSRDAFERGVIKMTRDLRRRGMRVTASCDFEDRVAAETGWNWRADAPEPPR